MKCICSMLKGMTPGKVMFQIKKNKLTPILYCEHFDIKYAASS